MLRFPRWNRATKKREKESEQFPPTEERNHPLRDRFGENGCQASAVLSRCERAGGRQGRGVKRRWGASVIKLGTSSVLIFCKSKPNEASSEPNRESLDSPTVYTEKRRCQVKSPIISKNFITTHHHFFRCCYVSFILVKVY